MHWVRRYCKQPCRDHFHGTAPSPRYPSRPDVDLLPVDKAGDLNYVVGFLAYDKDLGELGKVSAYIPHDMNPVFLLDYQGRELIVPAVQDFIEQIDPKNQLLHLILPEGLTSV